MRGSVSAESRMPVVLRIVVRMTGSGSVKLKETGAARCAMWSTPGSYGVRFWPCGNAISDHVPFTVVSNAPGTVISGTSTISN